ncbi:DNA repair protein RecO [Lacrimispora sp. NSJ-141]|uniref:DNA repair protein RecO n=1 Tax=Lientehia hominis TaxID=2897778 RepID=A0AAP2RFT5_9FIRM|nr:DNA repair protein RecO [Lientehia hominis]MCD2491414.1 DNA repair protein RecO [Lientehia hominis]
MERTFSDFGSDNLLQVTGLVLSAAPIGEYDKRVVILTRERGKLHAFAKGARKQNSPLISGTRPFCFGSFSLYEGRSSYTLKQLEITNYFEEVTSEVDYVYLGYYFLEFADYYSRENGDEFSTLKLLYQALRALSRESLDNRLVRLVYELRMMTMNGDFDGECFKGLGDAGRYTVDFIINTPVEKLFTFAVSDQVFAELTKSVAENKIRFLDREFKSEQVLNSINIILS